MDNAVINNVPTMTPKKNNTPVIFIIVFLLLAAGVGGYFYMNRTAPEEETKTVVAPTVTPTPTPKPVVNKAEVKIQVVNGTGTPGQAGEVVEALEKAGYNADNIETGNAEEYDNTTTTITARDNFKDAANDIKEILTPSFDSISVESTKLEADSEFDVVIVTGGKIYETPTPSSAPTSSPTPTIQTTTTPTTTPTSTPTSTPTPTT